MEKKKDNRVIDEAMEEIIKNQTEGDAYKLAVIAKNFYDGFIKVGFAEPLAEKMIIAMMASIVRRNEE